MGYFMDVVHGTKEGDSGYFLPLRYRKFRNDGLGVGGCVCVAGRGCKNKSAHARWALMMELGEKVVVETTTNRGLPFYCSSSSHDKLYIT